MSYATSSNFLANCILATLVLKVSLSCIHWVVPSSLLRLVAPYMVEHAGV